MMKVDLIQTVHVTRFNEAADAWKGALMDVESRSNRRNTNMREFLVANEMDKILDQYIRGRIYSGIAPVHEF